jgi:hypothetical protein
MSTIQTRIGGIGVLSFFCVFGLLVLITGSQGRRGSGIENDVVPLTRIWSGVGYLPATSRTRHSELQFEYFILSD